MSYKETEKYYRCISLELSLMLSKAADIHTNFLDKSNFKKPGMHRTAVPGLIKVKTTVNLLNDTYRYNLYINGFRLRHS